MREESDSFPTCLGPIPGAAEPSPGDQVEAAAGTGGCRNGGQEPGPFLRDLHQWAEEAVGLSLQREAPAGDRAEELPGHGGGLQGQVGCLGCLVVNKQREKLTSNRQKNRNTDNNFNIGVFFAMVRKC